MADNETPPAEKQEEAKQEEITAEEIQAQLMVDVMVLKNILLAKGIATEDEIKATYEAVIAEMEAPPTEPPSADVGNAG